jgi:hypothetical protein
LEVLVPKHHIGSDAGLTHPERPNAIMPKQNRMILFGSMNNQALHCASTPVAAPWLMMRINNYIAAAWKVWRVLK